MDATSPTRSIRSIRPRSKIIEDYNNNMQAVAETENASDNSLKPSSSDYNGSLDLPISQKSPSPTSPNSFSQEGISYASFTGQQQQQQQQYSITPYSEARMTFSKSSRSNSIHSERGKTPEINMKRNFPPTPGSNSDGSFEVIGSPTSRRSLGYFAGSIIMKKSQQQQQQQLDYSEDGLEVQPQSPLSKLSSVKQSVASLFGKRPSAQSTEDLPPPPLEQRNSILGPLPSMDKVSVVSRKRGSITDTTTTNPKQRPQSWRPTFLPTSSTNKRSQSVPIGNEYRNHTNRTNQHTEYTFSQFNFRHDSTTGLVLQVFRKLDVSASIPQNLKRLLLRLACTVIPQIHNIEEKLEEWPWLVTFCENWGIAPLTLVLAVFAAAVFQRVYRRNAKLISNYIGFVYPLYRTAVMLLTPSSDPGSPRSPPRTARQDSEMEKWKSYWPIYAGIMFLDEISPTLLQIYPLYYTTKSAFCYWLYTCNGSDYIFKKYIEPLWQNGIDAVSQLDEVVAKTGKTEFDYMKEPTSMTSEIARHRLKRIWHKTSQESRKQESRQNVLKSLCLTRDNLISSKEERSLREDIEKADEKLALLAEAQRGYKSLIHWFVDANGLAELAPPTGKINALLRIKLENITVTAATDSTPTPTTSKQQLDHFAVISINDSIRATTSKLTSSIWNETFEIPVDKLSNSVEIQVYQLSLLGKHTMVGVVWFTIAELKEELLDKYYSIFPVDTMPCTFALEPIGSISVKANLVETARIKHTATRDELSADIREEDIYLFDDIRKVYTKNGHQFQIFKAVTSFASDIVGARCSVCEEAMIGGMRCYCQRCAFVCHTRCFKGVLTKCINHDDIEMAPKGTDLNTGQLLDYNKPHTFEPKKSINLLRSWCTHCGTKVLVGEKLVQCSECGKCAHDRCCAMVPNFCKLSLADAAAIAIKEEYVNSRKLSKALGFGK
ncbi:Serine/threonine kinase [Chytriomyces hyalinus]|nr:Serine/threonine kinase [Chytriomyces hyalinus]